MDNEIKYIKYKLKYINLQNNILKDKIIINNNMDSKNNNLKLLGGAKKNKKNNMSISKNINIKYTEHVSEPWFSLISLGLKTVEGRKNKGRFKEMQIGDIVKWINNDFPQQRSVITEIIGKAEYPTFKEYLETEGLEKCLPGATSIDFGLSVYYKYFTVEDEKEYGVVAIRLKKI